MTDAKEAETKQPESKMMNELKAKVAANANENEELKGKLLEFKPSVTDSNAVVEAAYKKRRIEEIDARETSLLQNLNVYQAQFNVYIEILKQFPVVKAIQDNVTADSARIHELRLEKAKLEPEAK